MNRLTIADLPLAGLKLVRRARLGDSRGYFARIFCADELRKAGWSGVITQINQSVTAQGGSIRGMHFQRPPHGEYKLVTCLRGAVWDVAVDIRAGSPTFLQHHGVLLTAEGGEALLIPHGFAHGFQTVSDDVELLYCHSAAYAGNFEGGLDPLDPMLDIAWPRPITELSERDRSHPPLTSDFEGVSV